MIKLTVNADEKIFNKSVVTIGTDADLALPEESLSPQHVKIIEQNDTFIAINQANDPFVTLNGRPFGKKSLKNHDTLQIGNATIKFYGEILPAEQETDQVPPPPVEGMVPTDKLTDILEGALENQRLAIKENEEIEAEKQADALLAANDWDIDKMNEQEIQDLLMQVEELENHQQSLVETPSAPAKLEQESQPSSEMTPPAPTSAPKSAESPQRAKLKNKGSLKDSYLSELDDENQLKTFSKKEGRLYEKLNFKALGMGVLALFILLTIIGIIFYIKVAATNSKDEVKAAESVADVAMALTFAQVHHIKPPNQNWSDPDFIKNNLAAVLSTDSLPLAQLDNHGQIGNISYFLRIYTSNDLSQFLIIAQPDPSLLQWFIPKASIIVYSKAMELKKTHDLKTINRLLLNPTTLDGNSANELTHLIKQADVIPLDKLGGKNNSGDFKTPKTLAHIRPGAEDLIYNAPRYYLFGESFLKKAQMLANTLGTNDYEYTFFQEEMKELAKYPNIILYTTHGIQWARQAQKQINLFSPNNKILIANLQLDSKGIIASSQLLMDEGPADVAEAEDSQGKSPAEDSEEHQPNPPTPADEKGLNTFDNLHPLYSKLKALALEYKNGMQPIDQEIKLLLESSDLNDNIALLDRLHTLLIKSEKNYQNDPEKLKKNQAALSFIVQLQSLLKKYRDIRQLEDEHLTHELTMLYQNYPNIPVAQFISYLNAAGFSGHVEEHIKLPIKAEAANTAIIESQVSELLNKIEESTTLEDLRQQVKALFVLLNLGKVPDAQKLLSYQNSVRVHVLEKLNDFLLSSENSLPEQELTIENRPLVANILKDAWVVDPDEFDFYLNEFDLRLQNRDDVQGD